MKPSSGTKLKPVLRDYHDIGIEFCLYSGFRNIVENGLDAGVRLGESVEKDMIAVQIGPDWRMVAVASPDYVAAHGCPVLARQTAGLVLAIAVDADHVVYNLFHERWPGNFLTE